MGHYMYAETSECRQTHEFFPEFLVICLGISANDTVSTDNFCVQAMDNIKEHHHDNTESATLNTFQVQEWRCPHRSCIKADPDRYN
jgi:hypothetical protein